MYADVITKSIKKALDETNRRRTIQTAYNEEHNITPTSIKKDVRDIIETTKIAEEKSEYDSLEDAINANKENLEKLIEDYTKEMREASKNLQFERAAELRDIIYKLNKKKK